MYPPALPLDDGHICASLSPLMALWKQAIAKALTGMIRAQIAGESESLNVNGLFKCTLNTQLSQNLLCRFCH